MRLLSLSVIFITLFLSACSTRWQLTSYPTQYESELGKLTSYCWADSQKEMTALEEQEPLGGHHSAFDSLIRSTIEVDLQQKGFAQTNCANAGFRIDYLMGSHDDISAIDTSTSNTDQANPYGPRWSLGGDNSVNYEGLKGPNDQIILVRHGTLHIAAFTAQNGMLWHRSAEKILNDRDDDATRNAHLVEAVHKLLEDFPSHK